MLQTTYRRANIYPGQRRALPNMPGDAVSVSSSNGRHPYAARGSAHEIISDSRPPTIQDNVDPQPSAHQVQLSPQQEQLLHPLPTEAAALEEARVDGNILGAFEFQRVRDNTPCEICNMLFSNAAAVARHKRSQHPPVTSQARSVQCQVCNVVLKNEYNLLRHLRVHGDDAFLPCTKCNALFTTNCSRTRHRRAVHGEERPKRKVLTKLYSCPDRDCNFTSHGRANMRRHFECVHLHMRAYACDVMGCPYRASTKGNLEAHKAYHRN